MADNTKLAYHVHVVDDNGDIKVFGPDDTVPAWARKKITNPSAWADTDSDAATADEPDAEPDENEDPYKGLRKADLEAEVAKRNEDREDDDQIVVGGNGTVADLKAALVADDAVAHARDSA